MSTHKLCARCKGYKLVGQFHAMAASPDGLQSYCKACMKAAVLRSQIRSRAESLRWVSPAERLARRQKWAAIAREAAAAP